ncbi:hypothetical protein VRC22_16290 [Pseudomonas poae]|uniref:hypothetical protein n=1 Tax=Pseudomonas poae TaxID=200451 RepID=UPI0030CB4E51
MRPSQIRHDASEGVPGHFEHIMLHVDAVHALARQVRVQALGAVFIQWPQALEQCVEPGTGPLTGPMSLLECREHIGVSRHHPRRQLRAQHGGFIQVTA